MVEDGGRGRGRWPQERLLTLDASPGLGSSAWYAGAKGTDSTASAGCTTAGCGGFHLYARLCCAGSWFTFKPVGEDWGETGGEDQLSQLDGTLGPEGGRSVLGNGRFEPRGSTEEPRTGEPPGSRRDRGNPTTRGSGGAGSEAPPLDCMGRGHSLCNTSVNSNTIKQHGSVPVNLLNTAADSTIPDLSGCPNLEPQPDLVDDCGKRGGPSGKGEH